MSHQKIDKEKLLALTLALRAARTLLDKHVRIEDRQLFLREAAEVLRQIRLATEKST